MVAESVVVDVTSMVVAEAESVVVGIVSMTVDVAVSVSVLLVVDAEIVAELAVAESDAILAAGSEKTPMEEVAVDDAESDAPVEAEVEDAVGAIEDDPPAMVLEAKETETEPLAPTAPSAPSSSPESLPSSSLSLPESSPSSLELSPALAPMPPEPSAPEGGTTALMGPAPAAGATIGAAGMKTKVTFRACEVDAASKAFADDARQGGVVASVQSFSRPFTMS